MQLSNRIVRVAGVVTICHHILAQCCDEIKEESGLYHHKVKKMVNTLLDTVLPLIKLTRSEKIIAEVKKNRGIVVDLEDLDEDTKAHYDAFNSFIEIIMNGKPSEVYNTSLVLDNIKRGKKLYTEEEVKILLEQK